MENAAAPERHLIVEIRMRPADPLPRLVCSCSERIEAPSARWLAALYSAHQRRHNAPGAL